MGIRRITVPYSLPTIGIHPHNALCGAFPRRPSPTLAEYSDFGAPLRTHTID
jgi:hypothetical protein